MNRSMRIRILLLSLSALVLLFGTQGTAWAQDATGRIVGNVTDPSGAAVPSAKIQDNGRERRYPGRMGIAELRQSQFENGAPLNKKNFS